MMVIRTNLLNQGRSKASPYFRFQCAIILLGLGSHYMPYSEIVRMYEFTTIITTVDLFHHTSIESNMIELIYINSDIKALRVDLKSS